MAPPEDNNPLEEEPQAPERELPRLKLSPDDEGKDDYPPLTLMEVWRMALTRPGSATYQHIIYDPNRTYQRVFSGLLVAGLAVPLGILLLLVIIFPGELTETDIANAVVYQLLTFLGVVILFFIVVGLSHFSANSTEKQPTTFRQAAYTFAAFFVPVMILQSVVAYIPFFGIFLVLLMYFYLMYLTVIALHNLYQLKGLQLFVAALPMAAYILFQMSASPV